MQPYLTDEEINRICEPLTQPAAQIRYLRKLGLKVEPKPSRRPLVARSEWERAMCGAAAPAQADATAGQAPGPDRQALSDLFTRRKNGTKTQRR